MRRAGIEVRIGLLEDECRTMLEAFSKFITQSLPFVTLKLAATLDGKIATAERRCALDQRRRFARSLVHRLRNEIDAVLVGAATVQIDDPQLTCRIHGGRNPYRVVLDSRLKIPLTAQLLHKDADKTIIATTARAPVAKFRAVEALGARFGAWRRATIRSRGGRCSRYLQPRALSAF